jgi:chromosome segregation ATPase
MAEVKSRNESEIQRLVSLVGILSDAEERLVSQLAELEAEAMEQSRHFNAEIGSLSLSLARKEQELTSSQAELETMRQRKMSLKELEAMDLTAQLAKSTRECDIMRLRTESLQEEIEKLEMETGNLQQELALAKLISSWQQKEKKTIQEEKIRMKQPQLCRSESLSVAKQPRTQHGGWHCGAV